MLYDYVLKYETEIETITGDKALNSMLDALNMPRLEKTSRAKIDHKVTVTDSPALPKQEFIDETRENILSCLRDSFAKDNTLNVRVLNTTFIGITNLIEKE